MCRTAWACDAKFECVSSTPFGFPVVPEVYSIFARSSPEGVIMSTAPCLAAASIADVNECGSPDLPLRQNASCTSGVFGRTSRFVRSYMARVAQKTAIHSESLSMCAQSEGNCASYMGTSEALSEYAAAARVAHSHRLFDIMPILEYSCTPISFNKVRQISTLSPYSSYVIHSNTPDVSEYVPNTSLFENAKHAFFCISCSVLKHKRLFESRIPSACKCVLDMHDSATVVNVFW
mmetsp:Transcript_6798/g.9176  ORF Transcript_6798/g.9176 Transcript_6798/m.9176 type:complete len:234 (+) Transcript_6798:941-1642(+)